MSKLYTLEEVKELCMMAFDDGFDAGHYDEQEKDGSWWVNNNTTNIQTVNTKTQNKNNKT